MATGSVISLAIHVLVGGVWVGAVAFTVGGVLPAARDGQINAAPLGAIAGRLRTVTRASAVLLVLTGLHLAVVRYDAGSIAGTQRGQYVLTMAVLWLVATGLAEAGAGRLIDGADDQKVREPARAASRLLWASAAAGGLVLMTGGALVGRFYFGA